LDTNSLATAHKMLERKMAANSALKLVAPAHKKRTVGCKANANDEPESMSALHSKADMCGATRDVRFGQKQTSHSDYRFASLERLKVKNPAAWAGFSFRVPTRTINRSGDDGFS
jgi:hypothetical protein